MADNSKIKNFKEKLQDKYRFIIYNDHTLEEVWHLTLTRLNILTVGGIGAILFTCIGIFLIALTPLKEFIPGFPDGNLQKSIMLNMIRADSLERVVSSRNMYLANLKYTLSGNLDSIKDASTPKRNPKNDYKKIKFVKSKEDTILRKEISDATQDGLYIKNEKKESSDFGKIHFFIPVNGIVINKFNFKEGHYGVDFVAGANELIKSVLGGTVISANWTLETGYTLQIQHENNLVSVYKHNASLLKKIGDHVKAGEPIAVIGNTGELTSGPHLHFELWHSGNPVNPEKFLNLNQ